MSFETISPNMNLPIPGVTLTDGPQWASDLNASLTLIDQHNHSSGSGVQVTPSGLNINSNLPFNSNNATSLRSVNFTSQSAPLALGSDLGCIYVSGVDLYYNDENGNQIQITAGGGVAGTPGSIANLTSPASASYVSGSGSFVWQQAVNTSADMDFGSAIMRNDTASSNALTLSPPPAMANNFGLTLPNLPASQKFMTLDSSGNMAAPWAVDGVTLEIASSTTVQVKDAGITTAKIADANVTSAKIQTNVNLDGNTVQENGKNVVVSNTNATSSLAIVRGIVNANGTIFAGEGFSISKTGNGAYTINFTTSFASTPAITTAVVSARAMVSIASQGASSCSIQVVDVSGGFPDEPFHFIAIGPRA